MKEHQIQNNDHKHCPFLKNCFFLNEKKIIKQPIWKAHKEREHNYMGYCKATLQCNNTYQIAFFPSIWWFGLQCFGQTHDSGIEVRAAGVDGRSVGGLLSDPQRKPVQCCNGRVVRPARSRLSCRAISPRPIETFLRSPASDSTPQRPSTTDFARWISLRIGFGTNFSSLRVSRISFHTLRALLCSSEACCGSTLAEVLFELQCSRVNFRISFVLCHSIILEKRFANFANWVFFEVGRVFEVVVIVLDLLCSELRGMGRLIEACEWGRHVEAQGSYYSGVTGRGQAGGHPTRCWKWSRAFVCLYDLQGQDCDGTHSNCRPSLS